MAQIGCRAFHGIGSQEAMTNKTELTDNSLDSPSRVYEGKVFHARYVTKRHSFKYSVFYFLLDLDHLQDLASSNLLFGYNCFAWFSFFDRDHGHGGENLKAWLHELLKEHNISSEQITFRILCMPRILGYAFNPISVVYCSDNNGELKAIVYEVNNTFGERVHYLIPVDSNSDLIHQTSRKNLFVSPFFDMSGYYNFHISQPKHRISLVIDYKYEKETRLRATFSGEEKPFTVRTLARLLLTYPLLTTKVIISIHLQAVKLLFKRVPFVKHVKSAEKTVIIGSDIR